MTIVGLLLIAIRNRNAHYQQKILFGFCGYFCILYFFSRDGFPPEDCTNSENVLDNRLVKIETLLKLHFVYPILCTAKNVQKCREIVFLQRQI